LSGGGGRKIPIIYLIKLLNKTFCVFISSIIEDLVLFEIIKTF